MVTRKEREGRMMKKSVGNERENQPKKKKERRVTSEFTVGAGYDLAPYSILFYAVWKRYLQYCYRLRY